MRARTGLWEPWVSNHPGPPSPNARRRPNSKTANGKLHTLDVSDDLNHVITVSRGRSATHASK
jgi:hypothetical protein